MRPWADVEELTQRTVQGIVRADESRDEILLECCADSYLRACYFTKAFAPLRNRSVQLEQFARQHDEIGVDQAPGRALIVQAYRGLEPCSLEGLLRIGRAIQIIRDETQAGISAEAFSDWLKQHFPHPDVLPPNSIVPSLHTPDLAIVRHIREASGISDRSTFSQRLLADTEIPPRARLGFIAHLEDGYALPKGREPGTYKLTRRTATVLHQQLGRIKNDIPPMSELMPASALAGPRRGQVSKALCVPFGNLVP